MLIPTEDAAKKSGAPPHGTHVVVPARNTCIDLNLTLRQSPELFFFYARLGNERTGERTTLGLIHTLRHAWKVVRGRRDIWGNLRGASVTLRARKSVREGREAYRPLTWGSFEINVRLALPFFNFLTLPFRHFRGEQNIQRT